MNEIRNTVSISFLLFIILLAFPVAATSTTLHVPGTHSKIQDAIDAAVTGDVVLVAPGTYLENIDFKGKAITVTSSGGPDVTVIDGGQAGCVVVFQSGESMFSVLEGFKITNGTGYVEYWGTHGGGICCKNKSWPDIKNIICIGNTADSGGGISCESSTPRIIECTVEKNKAGFGLGGGIYCSGSSPLIFGCVIKENTSSGNAYTSGGGIGLSPHCSPVIEHCTIESNSAENCGGGIKCHSGYPVIFNCVISNNTAYSGGGLWLRSGLVRNNLIIANTAQSIESSHLVGFGGGVNCSSGIPLLDGNVIADNKAMMWGGGIYYADYKGALHNNVICNNSAGEGTLPSGVKAGGGVFFSGKAGGSVPVINCLIYGNHSDDVGGGIFMQKRSKVFLLNCSLTKNSSRKGSEIGTQSNTELTITNSILWGNTGEEIFYETHAPRILYSDVKGGYPGSGNIDRDPLFVEPDKDDFHLLYNSPCRDAGDNSQPALLFQDFEGDPRIAGGLVDMGADEFHLHLYGTENASPGDTVDLNVLGLPGKDTLLFIAQDYRDPPVATKFGEWYLLPPLTSVGLGTTPWQGLISLTGRIPPFFPTPASIPLQALVRDELTNLFILEVE